MRWSVSLGKVAQAAREPHWNQLDVSSATLVESYRLHLWRAELPFPRTIRLGDLLINVQKKSWMKGLATTPPLAT